jgi:nucleoside-diphosphate-sugar epimerase
VQASRHVPSVVSSNGAAVKQIIPPFWLVELFGPSRSKFSAAKAHEVLGWKPRIKLEEGQRRALEWLKYVRALPPQ